jgi:hypothetical protein
MYVDKNYVGKNYVVKQVVQSFMLTRIMFDKLLKGRAENWHHVATETLYRI